MATCTINTDTPFELAGPVGTDVFYRVKTVADTTGKDVTVSNIILSSEKNRRGLAADILGMKSFTVADCQFSDYTNTLPGFHNDCVKVSGNCANITFRNLRFTSIGPGTMPIHCVDSVSSDTITLENITMTGCSHPLMIAGQSPVRLLVIKNCKNIRVAVGQTVVGQPQVQWIGDCTGSVVYGQTAPALVDPRIAFLKEVSSQLHALNDKVDKFIALP